MKILKIDRLELTIMKRNNVIIHMVFTVMMAGFAEGGDTNPVFSPCSDAKVSKLDGFTFGIAFSTKGSFFMNQTQLSPCDSRLALPASDAKLAVFRPKVDELSLISILGAFDPVCICLFEL